MRASTYPLVDAAAAHETVLRLTPVLGAGEESIALCAGRVLAADLVAPRALPPWPASAVDGYAVRAADAGSALKVVGESAAGRPLGAALEPGTAARILTGGVLPDGGATVVRVGDTSLASQLGRSPAGMRTRSNVPV